jgi:hypothetical protein
MAVEHVRVSTAVVTATFLHGAHSRAK